MSRRPSLRAAIDRKCKSCIYDAGARGKGTWLNQVAECSSTNCPLWPVRPLPSAVKASNAHNDDAGDAEATDVAGDAGSGLFGDESEREGAAAA